MYFNSIKITFLVTVLCMALLVTNGCTSTRFLSSIKKQSLESHEFSGYKLKIVSVAVLQSYFELEADTMHTITIPSASADDYMKIAMERYPSLFSKDPNAFPVSVTVRDTWFSHSMFIPTLTDLLSAGTLPGYPNEVILNINAEIVFSDHDSHEICLDIVRFERSNHTWLSVFTPLGLIPVPGHSDLPKASAVMASSSFVKESSNKLTMISIIDAIVQSALNCGVHAFKERGRRLQIEGLH